MRYKYTKQEAFDKVVKHLITQGEPSVGAIGCAYQTKKGLQCAAGCLITDNETRLKAEGNWTYAVQKIPKLATIGQIDFICNLQLAHDGAAGHQKWRALWVEEMKKLANKYKLKSGLLTKLANKDWQKESNK